MTKKREIERNKSSFCVMPLLGIKRDELYWDFFYLNCYVGIKERKELNNHFCLLFKFKGTQDYLTVKEKLIQHEYFKEEISHTSKTSEYKIFVFTVNIENAKAIALFKKGKYSKFSDSHKNLISKVHKLTKRKELYHILKKTESRRIELAKEYNHSRLEDFDELWSMPKPSKEILTLNKLK